MNLSELLVLWHQTHSEGQDSVVKVHFYFVKHRFCQAVLPAKWSRCTTKLFLFNSADVVSLWGADSGEQKVSSLCSLYCVRQHLLCEARNVISCTSINSARAVKPFQPFISTTVIPSENHNDRKMVFVFGLYHAGFSVLFTYTEEHFV